MVGFVSGAAQYETWERKSENGGIAKAVVVVYNRQVWLFSPIDAGGMAKVPTVL